MFRDDTGASLWRREAIDARGNVTNATYGNGVEAQRLFSPEIGRLVGLVANKNATSIQNLGYTFSSIGNLTARHDANQNLHEQFTYDALNRMTQVTTTFGYLTGNEAQEIANVAYDHRGNITAKTGVGVYTYGLADASCGSLFAGVHAVTSIAGVKNATYCYDDNGNMTEGDGRTITWAPFDKPTQITRGANTVTFAYGPDRARFRRVDTTLAAGTSTTTYAMGGAYEVVQRAAQTDTKHYIGDFAVITDVTAAGPGGGLHTTRTASFFHRDNLVSIDAITDENGTVIQRMSFDAWGKRRETNWQEMTPEQREVFDTSITTRGYTGHEMVDPVGLVHMNGRVYDADIGRSLFSARTGGALSSLSPPTRTSRRRTISKTGTATRTSSITRSATPTRRAISSSHSSRRSGGRSANSSRPSAGR